MITLICPTRDRPQNMRRMIHSALETASAPDNLRLMIGVDDDESSLYMPYIPHNASTYSLADWGVVHSINVMAEFLMGCNKPGLFMVAPDDVIFETKGWDEALIKHYKSLENKVHVYCLQDSRDADGTPHPIVTREYIQAMGYLFPPIFLHWYVDHWTAEIAKANGCFTHLRSHKLIHDKPSDHGICDETHKRVRNRGWNVRDRFVADKCDHFLTVEKDRLRMVMQMEAGTREHMD